MNFKFVTNFDNWHSGNLNKKVRKELAIHAHYIFSGKCEIKGNSLFHNKPLSKINLAELQGFKKGMLFANYGDFN